MLGDPDQEIAEASQHPREGTDLKICAACGTEIDPTRRHLAATPSDDPSTVYLFCSDGCRDEWTADRTDD